MTLIGQSSEGTTAFWVTALTVRAYMCISAPLQPAFILAFTVELEAYRGRLLRRFGRELSAAMGAGLIEVVSMFTFIRAMKVTRAELAPGYYLTPTCECFGVQIEIDDSPVQRL